MQSGLLKDDKIIYGCGDRNEAKLARGYKYRPLVINSYAVYDC